MSRREKLFWLSAGTALILLVLSVIPSSYPICEVTEQTKEAQCTRYQVAHFLGIKVPEFLDVHNWLVTALFAGLVTLFTWRLWQATNELRVSTDKLWDAGENQRLLAEKTAERQLRAYIVVESNGLVEQDKTHGKFVFNIKIINSGQTPAYELQVISVTDILPHPVPKNFDFSINNSGDDNPSVSMLGPKGETTHDSLAHRTYDDSELIMIRSNGPRRLHCFGTVSYVDAFKVRRFTNFCYFLSWEPEHIAVQVAQHHNDAN